MWLAARARYGERRCSNRSETGSIVERFRAIIAALRNDDRRLLTAERNNLPLKRSEVRALFSAVPL